MGTGLTRDAHPDPPAKRGTRRVISEKQKRLCMRFADGRLTEADPPDWFVRVLETTEDWDDWSGSLHKAGASGLDSFGDIETFEIYRAPNGYFVDYCDVSESAAWIFIDSPVDYVTFRATYLAPLAMLSMKAERFEEWRQDRQAKTSGR